MTIEKKREQKIIGKSKLGEKQTPDNLNRQKELAIFLKGIGTPEVTDFVPDDFQLQAIDLVTKVGCDVLVAAPTGSGKTWIATESIKHILSQGSRAWYTSPLKALSNDKFREFSKLFGEDKVGILTGDRKINPHAPLIVATTEIYRNSLYDAMNSLEIMNIGLVVFDEVHYLADRERGVVWEEAIIYSPTTVRALMLSATVGNAEELSDWVAWARGTECRLVYSPTRPVPMRTGFVDTDGHLYPLTTVNYKLHPDIAALYEAKHPLAEERRRRKPSKQIFKFRNR
ncbi:MAG: DEAD/DEAH box helicase [Acidobacteria bacterium]|nr:DEAD/DEAH box helicase [Acidobacteriota bacterium]